jgi:putative DNA primase/helicase
MKKPGGVQPPTRPSSWRNSLDFNAKLFDAGIDPADIDYGLVGEFQRVRTADKPRSLNGAVLVLETRPLRVWFQNWATGLTGVASEGGPQFASKLDLAKLEKARARAEAEKRDKQRAAAAKAQEFWDGCEPADPAHPYLQKKQVQPHRLRQSEDGHLVVPMHAGGKLVSVQTISPDGEKWFLSGGRKKGAYSRLGAKPTATLLLCEGFATGASLHECLALPVAVCFDASNLEHAGRALRAKLPNTTFVFCGDSDETPGNPGKTAAIAAAKATRGRWMIPIFTRTSRAAGCTDYNDFRNRYGDPVLKQAFLQEMARVG